MSLCWDPWPYGSSVKRGFNGTIKGNLAVVKYILYDPGRDTEFWGGVPLMLCLLLIVCFWQETPQWSQGPRNLPGAKKGCVSAWWGWKGQMFQGFLGKQGGKKGICLRIVSHKYCRSHPAGQRGCEVWAVFNLKMVSSQHFDKVAFVCYDL